MQPMDQVTVETLELEDDGTWPNNQLPVILYRGVFKNPTPNGFEELLHQNNWGNSWRDSIYAYHHYHSNAHEFLGCYAGDARVQLGGPEGETVLICAGDAIVLPAGTAHKLIDSSRDFCLIGAYPASQDFDLFSEEENDRSEADVNIRDTPIPDSDPLYGADGPLRKLWKKQG